MPQWKAAINLYAKELQSMSKQLAASDDDQMDYESNTEITSNPMPASIVNDNESGKITLTKIKVGYSCPCCVYSPLFW